MVFHRLCDMLKIQHNIVTNIDMTGCQGGEAFLKIKKKTPWHEVLIPKLPNSIRDPLSPLWNYARK